MPVPGTPADTQDLVALVPDGTMKHALEGVIARHHALGIRKVSAEVFVHPEHDPGVYLRSHQFLRELQSRYSYALVMLDREGCGSDDPPDTIETTIQENLDVSGWQHRSAVVAIDPELEVWVWSSSPQIAAPLGWPSRNELVCFLNGEGLWPEGHVKPPRPKEAFTLALREKGTPLSSSIFRELADRIGLGNCSDASFARLKAHLRRWFGEVVGNQP
jgi:hypothetical protein